MKKQIIESIEKELFANQDLKYKDFQAKLMPTVDKEKIIGVRTPVLRTLAKTLCRLPEISDFLDELPHDYYDEYNLHGFIVSELKDFDTVVRRVDEILPYVDNWATCDLLSPKVFKKNKAKLLGKIDEWLSSGKVYTIRFGIEMLMSHYLDGDFKPEYLNKVTPIRSDEYYVNMMIAWFFATALTKQWTATIPVIENRLLDKWTHNKTIQKAIESYRITPEQKEYLKTQKY